jgi:hypothetical protein
MRWLLVLSLTGLAACSSSNGQPRAEPALPEPITVSSPAFTAGSSIPPRFTCGGDDVSPPLAWSSVPAGTVQIAPWSMIQTRPEVPTCTGSSSASTRPTPNWPRPRFRRAADRSPTAPARSPTPAPALPVAQPTTTGSPSTPFSAPRRRRRRPPRGGDPGYRGGRHRPRAVGRRLRPLNGGRRHAPTSGFVR